MRKEGSAAPASAARSVIVRSGDPFDTTLRRQLLIERIHRLGPRVVLELIDELARRHELGPDLDARLERYAAADPLAFAIAGAARFPALPIWLIT
jgi:hypothetical protein